jgi:hypothetical protein
MDSPAEMETSKTLQDTVPSSPDLLLVIYDFGLITAMNCFPCSSPAHKHTQTHSRSSSSARFSALVRRRKTINIVGAGRGREREQQLGIMLLSVAHDDEHEDFRRKKGKKEAHDSLHMRK